MKVDAEAPQAEKCSVDICERNKWSRGFCLKHYKRALKGNDPHAPTYRDKRPAIIVDDDIALLPLGVQAKNGYAKVDKEFAWLGDYSWSLNKAGYASRSPLESPHLLHHYIVGKPPKGLVTDHINRDKLDNRKVNLRHTTASQNSLNSTLSKGTLYSVHRGVTYDKTRGRWKAEFTINYKTHVAYRDTESLALKARKELERIYYV